MLQPLQWGNPAKKPKIQKEKKCYNGCHQNISASQPMDFEQVEAHAVIHNTLGLIRLVKRCNIIIIAKTKVQDTNKKGS